MKRGLALFLVWLIAVTSLAADYQIRNLDVLIKIQPTGHLRITEKIDVVFNIPQRGIYRRIPFRYSSESIRDRRLVISQFFVKDQSGTALKTLVEQDGQYISCRIGDENIYLPPQVPYTYVIQYDVYGAINRFPADGGWEASAELYWNAIGPEWTTTIQSAQVRVEFPTAVTTGQLRARVFEGRYGSEDDGYLDKPGQIITANSRTVMTLSESELQLDRNAPMLPGTALTVVVGLPDAMILTPTMAQKLQYEWSPFFGFLVPVITLVVMPILWLIFGRDSTRRVRETETAPPDQVSGHVIGAVVDGRVDKQDISALLVSLAIKGKVTFDSTDGASRTKICIVPDATNVGLDAAESHMFDLLQLAGPTVTQSELKDKIAPSMPTVRELIMREAVASGYYGAIPNHVYTAWALLGSLVVVGMGFGTYLLEPMRDPTIPIIGSILGIVIAVLFAKHMPKVTRKGAETRARAKNFSEWMAQASAREDWRDYLTRNPNLFEDFLPHAIALGRHAQWIHSWYGIRHKLPAWWVAPSGVFDLNQMGTSFSTVSEKVSTAATTLPRSASSGSGFSSSSGGGGFSGGGFGGGGGGSW